MKQNVRFQFSSFSDKQSVVRLSVKKHLADRHLPDAVTSQSFGRQSIRRKASFYTVRSTKWHSVKWRSAERRGTKQSSWMSKDLGSKTFIPSALALMCDKLGCLSSVSIFSLMFAGRAGGQYIRGAL